MKNYVIIDMKTNGYDKNPFNKFNLIKIEAIKLDKNFNAIENFLDYIKPTEPLSKEIEELTKITNDTLNKRGVTLKEGLENFLEFIKDSMIIGYNTNFEISFLLKGIYETKIEDHPIDFVSLKEYLKYTTDIKNKIKSLTLENVANYYNIKYMDISKEQIEINKSLLKKLIAKEKCNNIEEFVNKNIPKILLPGLSKRDTRVKVRFLHGQDEFARRNIEFIDKTKDRKVSYLTHYNAINRYDTTFYELVLFRRWGCKIIDDFININDITIDFIDYYNVRSNIDLSIEKDILEKIKSKIEFLDKYKINLGCIGTIEELKENYKILGEDDLNKILSHIKIFGKNR